MSYVQGHLRLSERPSGVISPSLTTEFALRRSTNAENRERLIFPMGSASTRMRAGATGENRSTTIATLGCASSKTAGGVA